MFGMLLIGSVSLQGCMASLNTSVIKKEGIKQSVVTYLGVLIGAVNTMYFYPKFFSEEELGLFRFLLGAYGQLL